MKIIDATWEKRNLGVAAVEIDLDTSDTVADLESIRDLDCEYSVARVPTGCVELMFELEDMGYRYIETMLSIQHDLKNIGMSLNSVAKRVMDCITYAEMSEVELIELRIQLKSGIISTDRVFLDPAFCLYKSANRYIGWISDILAQGGRAYKSVLGEKVFGFFVSGIDVHRVNHVYILGTYKDYENAGLGVCLINASIRQAYEFEATKSVSDISTNNISAIKANLAAGYQITSARYIYVRHN